MRSVLITACVLAGLLLGQVVSMRHSHGEHEPLGHAAAPHLHLRWFSSHASHSHGDECDHDSSHEAADHDHATPTGPAPADHEDAVYVSELIAVVSEGKTSVVNDSGFGESMEFDLTFAPTAILTLAQAVPRPPLKTDLQELSVFLRTFSLRI